MKSFWIISQLLLLLFVSSEALGLQTRAPNASPSTFTCRYISGYGEVTGRGSSKSEAFRDAANKCFDQQVSLSEQRGIQITEERGLDIIDACANIQCS